MKCSTIDACILFLLIVSSTEAANWAVLVAGSSGYYNYRHQSDVCHAYQILHKNGIPDERIIVFMYDDIAQNRRNPTKGVLINEPNGPNVYAGVPKDYTGKNVTPKNFLRVLRGESMDGIGSGKTLKSTSNDNVFIYFSDHGGPNVIAFPRQELHAKDLQAVLEYMHSTKMYNQLVFYLEACESGSMFDKELPDNIGIFATTAANGKESSYAWYYDKKRRTYLADQYSAMWMQDSDKGKLDTETLLDQYAIVKQLTNKSHVQKFGDESIGNEVLHMFQAENNAVKSRRASRHVLLSNDAVPSPDVEMMTLYKMLMDSNNSEEKRLIQEEMIQLSKRQRYVKEKFELIVRQIFAEGHPKAKEMLTKKWIAEGNECYKKSIEEIKSKCFESFDFETYPSVLSHIYILANLCEEGLQVDVIAEAIQKSCNIG